MKLSLPAATPSGLRALSSITTSWNEICRYDRALTTAWPASAAKTHKCLEIARRQVALGARLTVATVGELSSLPTRVSPTCTPTRCGPLAAARDLPGRPPGGAAREGVEVWRRLAGPRRSLWSRRRQRTGPPRTRSRGAPPGRVAAFTSRATATSPAGAGARRARPAGRTPRLRGVRRPASGATPPRPGSRGHETTCVYAQRRPARPARRLGPPTGGHRVTATAGRTSTPGQGVGADDLPGLPGVAGA